MRLAQTALMKLRFDEQIGEAVTIGVGGLLFLLLAAEVDFGFGDQAHVDDRALLTSVSWVAARLILVSALDIFMLQMRFRLQKSPALWRAAAKRFKCVPTGFLIPDGFGRGLRNSIHNLAVERAFAVKKMPAAEVRG